ncbi:hypothetical protein FO519_009929 [Halicephalobus sp. NKZ332]|nr:hypothetical protein FO519_009929 [Halicephalobus sp. NKZ332]
MCFFIKFLVILLSLKNVVETCIQTRSGGDVVVTACDPNDITFVAGDGVTSITGTNAAPVVGADGTTTMVVTCDATGTPTAITLMTDQNGAVLGSMVAASRIDTTLVCDANGDWTFPDNAAAGVVTEVHCDFGIPNTDPCNGCPAVPGTGDPLGTVVGPTVDVNQCTATVTCNPQAPGGPSFLQFNGNIGNPNGNMAMLTCTNGAWMFDQNGVPLTVNTIECIG